MKEKSYIAVDVGASSGRLVVGHFDGERLRLEEIHRFENGPVEAGDHLHWDLLSQWAQICRGLRAAGAKFGDRVASVGVDTWGVDYALLGPGDELLGNPYHYRDSRTNGMMEKAIAILGREKIFRRTGVQFMPFNTLYQLLATKLGRSQLMDIAETMLMMPDVFHWLLSGVKCNEMTEASTTQFYNPVERDWAWNLLSELALPSFFLGRIVQPGTKLGPLRDRLAAETGLTSASVVLPGSHDTASAVMAVPAAGRIGVTPNWCYISLGTWALMGVESPQPVLSDAVMRYNFTNEGGVGGTTRLLKNISGLWLVQECRRVWNSNGENLDWEAINQLAAAAPPSPALIDPDAPEFLAPTNMPEAICDHCRKKGQPVPSDKGAIIRCVLESLAHKFRETLYKCEELVGGKLETIHIVGGGTQNKLLCQMTADACGRRVLAGPVEATAIGNIMMQAVGLRDVASIAQAREIIRRSFAVEEYLPSKK